MGAPRIVASSLCGLLLVTQVALADLFDIEWELRRDKEQIQVYTGDVEGSKFKAVKATMELEASLGEFVALVMDSKSCPDWAELCKHSEQVSTTSETEMIVYTLNDLPWPVTDRDANAAVRWSQDPQTLAVEMLAKITTEGRPPRKGTLRLQYGVTGWTFTPVGDGRVAVESRAHLDPGGATPAWLTNRLLVDAPYQTLSKMRELILTRKYEGSSISFVREPTAVSPTQ